MDLTEQRPPRRERNGARWLAGAAALMMLWSISAAPPSIGQEEAVAEPEEIAAYATFADAMPVQTYIDHQVRLVPLTPAIAHSQTEVSLPSAAMGIAWLVDGGVANGLHGTTTGAKVPTEASANQPGGEPEEEFSVAGGPIGADAFMRVQAGRAFASARHSDQPKGYGNAFLTNLWVLPAAGSPKDPPGTFDPDATYPGGEPGQTDPAPRGQMAILTIGKVASTSESLRNGTAVISTAVAELKDINIGNRTSDNRCTNCIRIDSIRTEAYAEANGTEGGARAAYRVLMGRACRRSFNAETGVERDQCLPLDPEHPEGNEGLRSIDQLEALNAQFEKPFWTMIPGGAVNYIVGIRLHAGSEHSSPSRGRRTTSPRDDVRRNYAYPEKPAKDKDEGQVAKAVAEGLDIEISTITVSQVADDVDARLKGTPAAQIIASADEDPEAPGFQISIPGPIGQAAGQQSILTDQIRSARRAHITLGVARASATARPALLASVLAPPAAPDAIVPPVLPGEAPGAAPAAPDASVGAGAGVPAGPMRIQIDWSSFRVTPWKPYDMAKAFAVAAIVAGAAWLMRRRLRAGIGG